MGNFARVVPQGGAANYNWTLAYDVNNANNVQLRI